MRAIDRHFAQRAAAGHDAEEDPLQATEPGLASLMRQSLFRKDELEALAVPKHIGVASAVPRKVGRQCIEEAGFNVRAATRIHACSRDRREH